MKLFSAITWTGECGAWCHSSHDKHRPMNKRAHVHPPHMWGLCHIIIDNIVGVIPNPFKVNQRAVIQFLTEEGCRPVNIHYRMQVVYGDKYFGKDVRKQKIFRGWVEDLLWQKVIIWEQPKSFVDSICHLPKKRDVCLNVYGDFFWWTLVHSWFLIYCLV